MIFDLALLGAGFVLLLFGAELLVRIASVVAVVVRAPPFLVGVLLVGFGTSLPELAVSVDAAVVGSGDLAIGNVIGSNLCNGALILGLTALLSPMVLAPRLLRWELPLLVVVSGVVAIFLRDAVLERREAALLLGSLGIYLLLTLRASRTNLSAGAVIAGRPTRSLARLSLGCAAGFGGLVLGANWLVEGAILIARDLGVSEAVIAICLVAIGTSLPELATTLAAGRRRATELVAGNLIGSNLFNTMAILGASGLVAPLHTVDVRAWELVAFVAAPAVIGVAALRGRLGRSAGATLLLGYSVFLAFVARGS